MINEQVVTSWPTGTLNVPANIDGWGKPSAAAGAYSVGEGDCFLIDGALFEGEGHLLSDDESRELRVDRRRGVSATASLLRQPNVLSSLLSPHSCSIFAFGKKL